MIALQAPPALVLSGGASGSANACGLQRGLPAGVRPERSLACSAPRRFSPAVARRLTRPRFASCRGRLLGCISHHLPLGSSRLFSLGITGARLMPMFLRLRAATMPSPGLALSPSSSVANFAGPHRLTPNRNFEGTVRKRRENPAPLAPGPST
jgi:hypothetical protein